MYTLLVILHIAASLTLILIVLLQAGKGADMGAAFGGSSQTVFGSSGAGTFLGKMTAGIAVLFMLTSLLLTYSASHRSSSSLLERSKVPVTEQKLPPASPNAATQPAAMPPVAPVSK
jgi:preprotein translocase subunit SecG